MRSEPTFISLFSGIGGLDLALEYHGWRCVGHVENDPYCDAVLAERWPTVPRWGDIRRLDWDGVRAWTGPVDLVAAGFPCQPTSQAGRRKAQADPRWLWPEVARCLRHLRPRWVFLENVPGLLSAGAVGRQAECVCGWFGRWGWFDLAPAVPDEPDLSQALYQAGLEGQADPPGVACLLRRLRRPGAPSAEPEEHRGLPLDGDGQNGRSGTPADLSVSEDQTDASSDLPALGVHLGVGGIQSLPGVHAALGRDAHPQSARSRACPSCGRPVAPAARAERLHGELAAEVVTDLAALGFHAEWCCVAAADVGAPHERDRVFVLAYATGARCPTGASRAGGPTWDDARWARSSGLGDAVAAADGFEPEREGDPGVLAGPPRPGVGQGTQRQRHGHAPGDRGQAVADPAGAGWGRPDSAGGQGRRSGPARGIEPGRLGEGNGDPLADAVGAGLEVVELELAWYQRTTLERGRDARQGRQPQSRVGWSAHGISAELDGHRWPAPPGPDQYPWEPPRTVGRGVPFRGKRVKALGNAVVPQQGALAFAVLWQRMLEEIHLSGRAVAGGAEATSATADESRTSRLVAAPGTGPTARPDRQSEAEVAINREVAHHRASARQQQYASASDRHVYPKGGVL